jgi:hypothetical protein
MHAPSMAIYLYLELSIFMFVLLFFCVCQTFNKELTYLLTYIRYRLDLHVDFIVFDATYLAVIEICHLTSRDDLENQGQS